jgi:hypothetical protein
MPNLTANQIALFQYIVAAHKAGESAKVEVSPRAFNSKTLSSLVARGLVRHFHHYPVHSTNRAGEPMPYYRNQNGPVYEVELTSEGWSYLYRINR